MSSLNTCCSLPGIVEVGLMWKHTPEQSWTMDKVVYSELRTTLKH